jgi:uncharacterized protein YbjT (DUF2867 family)
VKICEKPYYLREGPKRITNVNLDIQYIAVYLQDKPSENMTAKTAALIGATGLIGSHLLKCLKDDDDFKTIRLLVRRPIEFKDPKVRVIVSDFADEAAFKAGIAGCDAVFCAVGTTNKKVNGDKAAYRKVDYDIPVKAAMFCTETGCRQFLLVSSVGASSKAGNFYLKLKGEVEDKVQSLSIPSVSIFRPSFLLGKRLESRPAEALAQAMSKSLSFLFPAKYKPIQAEDVAKAMLAASKQDKPGFRLYHFREMKALL